MTHLENIKVIAFDADDTLWDNETYFQQVEADMCRLMERYASAEETSRSLFATEMANMRDYGYGAVAFTLSLVENAIKVSKGAVSGDEIMQIIALGRSLMRLEATPLPGVVDCLAALKGHYRLVVFTKGELLTQEHKLQRSGLTPYFERIVIVSDKQPKQYEELCLHLGIEADELLMVGNSLKSDIRPALEIGASAVHVPFEVMWQHEIIEDFEHPRMTRIKSLDELPKLLAIYI